MTRLMVILGVVLCMSVGVTMAQDAPAPAPLPEGQASSKAVLITGASSGFGRATTERLAAQGHFVYAGARKQEDLDALNAIPNVKAIRLDVTSQAEIDAAVAMITAEGRGLHGLVNNAGVAILFPLTEVDELDLKYVFDINIWGPWRVTKAFAPLLVESKGRVVNLSSISGIFAAPLLGPYSMSKHAMEAFSETLRGEIGKLGVQVATIEPGNFGTEIGQTAFERMQERGQSYTGSPFEAAAVTNMERLRSKEGKEGPARVAEAIADALLSPTPKARYLVVSNERDAEVTLRSHINKLAQLNQDHSFSYGREKLVQMLDEALAQAASTSQSSAAPAMVTGSLAYRERIALPPTAVIKVQLVDVSRADAPAVGLGEQTIEAGGRQVPFAFEIPYEPGRIEANHSYAVQARIEDGGRLLFITDQRYPVITRGAATQADLVLRRVQPPPSQ